MDLLKKERICSTGSKFFPFRIDSFSEQKMFSLKILSNKGLGVQERKQEVIKFCPL